MGRKGTSYECLVRTYNRSRKISTKTLCECGKEIFSSQLEKHLQTKMHKQLLTHKIKFEEYMKKEQERLKQRRETIDNDIIKCQDSIRRLQESYNSLIKEKDDLFRES